MYNQVRKKKKKYIYIYIQQKKKKKVSKKELRTLPLVNQTPSKFSHTCYHINIISKAMKLIRFAVFLFSLNYSYESTYNSILLILENMGPLTNNEATIRVAQLSFSTGTNLIKVYIYTSNHSLTCFVAKYD